VELELGRPNDDRPPFRYSAVTRVQFSDTDAQGVVYYGRYLPYFDMARVEYLRHLGLGGMRPAAVEFVMRAQSVEYLAPARFDDLLEVFIRTRRIGRTSVTQALAAYRARDGELMCRAEQTLVMIDVSTHRPVPVSEEFRRAVTAFEGTLEADA
jgi:acyl-CoA thioester hydrolase